MMFVLPLPTNLQVLESGKALPFGKGLVVFAAGGGLLPNYGKPIDKLN
jgi:hypothetical protein